MSYIEQTLIAHVIIGTEKGRQGAGQVLPEDLVLDVSCGWMCVSDYHYHLVDVVDKYIEDVI